MVLCPPVIMECVGRAVVSWAVEAVLGWCEGGVRVCEGDHRGIHRCGETRIVGLGVGGLDPNLVIFQAVKRMHSPLREGLVENDDERHAAVELAVHRIADL